MPHRKDWPPGFDPRQWLLALGESAVVLAAASGGADSTALALLLAELLPGHGHRLEIAHVHHGVRGASADGDAKFVGDLAERLGVPFHLLRVDPALLIRGEGQALPNEAALREARLGLLRATAAMTGARAIALAHHMDDVAETFLLMALRGSGPGGLGMRASRAYTSESENILIRPLLECSREDMENFLKARGEAWRHDETNDSPRYRRNRIRNEVIPLLRSIEPAATDNIANSARLCEEAGSLLAELADAASPRIISARSPQAILVSLEALRREPRSLHGEILRRRWAELASSGGEDAIEGPTALPPRALVEAMIERVAREEGDESNFGPHASVQAVISNRVALLGRALPSIEDATVSLAGQLPVAIVARDAAEFTVWNGVALTAPRGWDVRILSAAECPGTDEAREMCAGEVAALIDPDALTPPLMLKRLRAGEEIELEGGRHKSVAECLAERHILNMMRPLLRAFCEAHGVLWIPGVRRAHRAQVGPQTRRVISIRRASSPDGK